MNRKKYSGERAKQGVWLMTFLDRIAAQFSRYEDRNLKILFWGFSILLVPLIAKIYWYPISLLTMLLLLPFGSAAEKHAGMIFLVETVVCFFFAIMTMIQLWRMLKNYRLENYEWGNVQYYRSNFFHRWGSLGITLFCRTSQLFRWKGRT